MYYIIFIVIINGYVDNMKLEFNTYSECMKIENKLKQEYKHNKIIKSSCEKMRTK